MPSLSRLEKIPGEIMDEIALSVVECVFLGPPIDLAQLLRSSKTISSMLSRRNNPCLYARIFRFKFDVGAPVRRLGGDCARPTKLSNELVRRFDGLKRLRRGLYPRGVQGDALDGGLRVDLWMAYLMFLENDGKNAWQLVQYAKIDQFAFGFVRPGGRLHDWAELNEEWTVDSEVNALAVWLFWFTDDGRLQCKNQSERNQILEALGCFYVGSFKYASTHAPLTYFNVLSVTLPPPLPLRSVLSLSTSPSLPPVVIPDHFGFRLTLARPLSTLPALLTYIARFESDGTTLGRPRTMRISAQSTGELTAGLTNVQEVGHETPGALEVESGNERAGSAAYDHDFMRLLKCHIGMSNLWKECSVRARVFTPGMLEGFWHGKWLAVPLNSFQTLLQTAQEHNWITVPVQPPVLQKSMSFRLREHHQHDWDSVLSFEDISTDGIGTGALRAWLPVRTSMLEQENHLIVSESGMRAPSRYKTYRRDQVMQDEALLQAGLYGQGVWDIILTAETEDSSEAQGGDRYVGRVRGWDGLIVLVREANLDADAWVFSGYIHGSQNMVGRWRETRTPMDVPGWEGAWGMVKRSA